MAEPSVRHSTSATVRYEIRWVRAAELAAVSASLFALISQLF